MATIVSPVCVPAVLWLTLREQVPPPTKTALFLLWTVVLPTMLGHALFRPIPDVQRKVTPIAKAIASLAILWIIAVVVGLNRDRLRSGTTTILVAVIVLNLAGYIVGIVAGRLFRFETTMQRALSLEIGMQNAGLGTTLAAQSFANHEDAMIPTALYTFGCMLTGTILARHWAKSDPTSERTDSES